MGHKRKQASKKKMRRSVSFEKNFENLISGAGDRLEREREKVSNRIAKGIRKRTFG